MRFAALASAMKAMSWSRPPQGAGEDVHGEDLLEEVGPRDAVGARRPVVLPRRLAGPRGRGTAGVDEVLTRGELVRRLDEILRAG